MGVEFTQCFFVRDLKWVGDQSVLARLHDVLAKWGLAKRPPTVFDIDDGGRRKVDAKLGGMRKPPANLLAEWDEPQQAPELERVLGASYFGNQVGAEDRYLMHLFAVVGTDFRTLFAADGLEVEVRVPPITRGREQTLVDERRLWGVCGEMYVAGPSSTPPVVDIAVTREGSGQLIPSGFTGAWRAGLIMDCGKDLPAFAGKRTDVPNVEFSQEVAEAFGTDLVQIGYFN